MSCVVITGADGFIGSHLSKFIASKGIDVYAIIIPKSPTKSRIEGVDNVHIIEANSQEYKTLSDSIPLAPLAFFHLAWAGVSPDYRDNVFVQSGNINMSLAALKLAVVLKSKKFILPGSTMEYDSLDGCIDENSVVNPQNVYGTAKFTTNYFCSVECKKNNIQYISAVISSIYAADRVDNNVIYYVINSLLERTKPSLTKLEQLWDYVYIDDVVNGLYLLTKEKAKRHFYAIGKGDNRPLSEYIYKIRDLIDPNLPLGLGEIPYKNNKINNSCVDIEPLKRDTGFFPKIQFDNGIRMVIEQVKKARKKG